MVNAGLVGITAIITFSIVFILFYWKEQAAKKPDKPTHSMKISEAIRKIQQLGRTGEFKEGMILIYKTLEGIAAQFLGIRRKPSQTPRDFVNQLSSSGKVNAIQALSIVSSFERAFYGDKLVSQEEFQQAVSALEETYQSALRA
ncbi:MAG: DUF4129 domain-containing protein [Candidatus Wukongarchaeota archaeon]|jgi:hypothetical protein|nr:DUF4129 domain-containing protein [Candidatus Wukongarchaeota archaeon]